MRMGSLAHNCKTIWQAKVGECPVGHRRFIRAVMCLCVAMGLIGSPVWATRSSEPVRTYWPKVGGFLEWPGCDKSLRRVYQRHCV